MRPVFVALLTFGASISATAAAAQGALYFYCYAPDTASGTVYMSQPQPVGPVAERAGYGQAYVAYLRSAGRLRGEVQAYCTMRGSVAELERARSRLSQEACPECAGIDRFESAAWSRGGAGEAPSSPVNVPEPRKAPPVRKGGATVETAQRKTTAGDPLIVIMGNTETGKLIKVSNQPDLRRRAEAQARAVQPTGWKTLLMTSEPGFGAAICVESEGETRFFVAHGHHSQKAAIAKAREKARAFALAKGGTEKICGAPWRARGGIDAPRETGAIDIIKEFVEDEATCDTRLPEVSERALSRERANPRGPQVEHEKLKKRGTDGRRPCVRVDMTTQGVRG